MAEIFSGRNIGLSEVCLFNRICIVLVDPLGIR